MAMGASAAQTQEFAEKISSGRPNGRLHSSAVVTVAESAVHNRGRTSGETSCQAQRAYHIAGTLRLWLLVFSGLLMIVAVAAGLGRVPSGELQQAVFRMLYLPLAAVSLGLYELVAVAAAAGLIWRMKLAHAAASALAVVGVVLTLLVLIMGSFLMRQTGWAWDERGTMEVIVLFFYAGYLGLGNSIDEVAQADRTTAILALVGGIGLPIVGYSISWWSSQHQGTYVHKLEDLGRDSAKAQPFRPLLSAILLYLGALFLMRLRAEIIRRDHAVGPTQEMS